MGNQSLMMIYKASEQAAMWKRKQNKRAEETRLKDFHELEALAKLNEQAWKDELTQAKAYSEQVYLQVQLEQDTME